MSYPARKAAGDQVPAVDFNDFTLNPVYTYGETIAIGAALYLKASDGKAWKAAATNQEAIDNFIGFAAEAGNANDTKYVIPPGKLATGLSSLTTGKPYFLSDTAGAISLTQGTKPLRVGVSASTTTLLCFLKENNGSIAGAFGDGSDGDVTISSPTTLTRDMFYNSLTFSADINANGFSIYVKTTMTRTGTAKITNNGGNGGNGVNGSNATGGTGGIAGAAPGSGTLPGPAAAVAGGAGAGGNTGGASASAGSPGVAGIAVTNSIAAVSTNTAAAGGNADGGGGAGTAAGGAAGAVATTTQTAAVPRAFSLASILAFVSGAVVTALRCAAGSPGSGGGGWGTGASGGNGGGGGGGGAGTAGGMVRVVARYIIDSGSGVMFQAIGGDGGKGGDGYYQSGNCGVGGGGAGPGGHGGVIMRIYQTLTGTATTSVVGGAAGAVGVKAQGGTGTASNGASASAGNAGLVIDIAMG